MTIIKPKYKSKIQIINNNSLKYNNMYLNLTINLIQWNVNVVSSAEQDAGVRNHDEIVFWKLFLSK